MPFLSIDPFRGKLHESFPELDSRGLDAALARASRAAGLWAEAPLAERSAALRRLAAGLRAEAQRLATIAALEMGKPVRQGRAEVEKCAWACEHYAMHAAALLAPEAIESDAARSYVRFDPLGVVLAIMPWNFPWWQVFRAAIPAVLAGNAMVLKHSSNICGCALAIQEIFEKAGFPPGVFAAVLMDSARIESLIADARVRAVTLTGSTAAGTAVARAAGGALKKCVLELGGSDPCVILEDADLELAARTCAASRVINSGQSCIAAKRFVVVEKVRKRFEELFVQAMSSQRVGQPREDSTNIGPLARADLRELVDGQVTRSIAGGARCLLGGSIPDTDGFFYPPTVLTNCRQDTAIMQKETFGPVLPIAAFTDLDHAIDMANDCEYGLTSSIYTQNIDVVMRACNELRFGETYINRENFEAMQGFHAGWRKSGIGGADGKHGLEEYLQTHVVYVDYNQQKKMRGAR